MMGWFKRWRERRADKKAIREALKFMSQWKTYDLKKADESPLPSANPFAAKVAALKKKANQQGDPYAFDKAMREMVHGVGSDERIQQQLDAAGTRLINESASKMKNLWGQQE